jgi:integrase/recombinase XerD
LEETGGYIAQYRAGWMKRAVQKRCRSIQAALFLNRRGCPVKKNTYQQAIPRAGSVCGFRATSHVLRATFGCWMLARLERLAKEGEAINPLLVVKILMGNEHIDTTDRYLRAVAMEARVLSEVLDTLLIPEGLS